MIPEFAVGSGQAPCVSGPVSVETSESFSALFFQKFDLLVK